MLGVGSPSLLSALTDSHVRRSWLRAAFVLGFLAVSAPLCLPFVYTCKTFRPRPLSCCQQGPGTGRHPRAASAAAGATLSVLLSPFAIPARPIRHHPRGAARPGV